MRNQISHGLVIFLIIAFGLTMVVFSFVFFAESDTSISNNALARAEEYEREGEYEKAVAEYEELIKKQPKNLNAYSMLSDLYEKHGETERAEQVLTEGIEQTDSALLILKLTLLRG